MIKIRVEISSLASAHTSGVGNYTRLLSESLSEFASVQGSYFNFAHRQPTPRVNPAVRTKSNPWIPLRVYAKLDSYNLAWPFDLIKSRVDLTIHPNFATWPTVRSKKTATVIHDLTFLYYPELVERKNLAHLRRVVPRTIRHADYIITVSDAVKKELIKEFHIESRKCLVTHIPPAPEFFTTSDIDIHKKYQIPTNDYFLFVGNLEPRKNLSTLLDAYLSLPKDIRSRYSLIIGGGKGWKFEQTAEKIQSAINNGERIRQIGFVDQSDLPALYQKAALFVMPSKYEGFGIPILESLASGTPVVAADIPVLRESGGNAALYANPSDPKDFAEKIIQALKFGYDDETAMRHLASFSWQQNAKDILTLL